MQLSDTEISHLKQEIATLEAQLTKIYDTLQTYSPTSTPLSISARQTLASFQHHTSHLHSEFLLIHHHIQSIETDWIEQNTVNSLKEISKIILGIVLLQEVAGSVLVVSKHTVNRLFLLSSAIGGVWLLLRLTAGTVSSWFGMLHRNKQRKMYVLQKLQHIHDHINAMIELGKLYEQQQQGAVAVEMEVEMEMEQQPDRAETHQINQPSALGSDDDDDNDKNETSNTTGGEIVLVVPRHYEDKEEASSSYMEMQPLRHYAALSTSPPPPSSSPHGGSGQRKKEKE